MIGSPLRARFSEDRVFRYTLHRQVAEFGKRSTVNFIGLNPSTADETKDDPTVRRCIGFARAWGFVDLTVTNIFAFRATDPEQLRKVKDPIGPRNDHYLVREASNANLIVVAWSGMYDWRSRAVRDLLRDFDLYCLGRTQAGLPRHPLYMPADSQPVRYQ